MPIEDLTPREFETMWLLDQHYSTIEVADRMFISEHTVRSHVKSALFKLDAHSRSEALRVLVESGALTRPLA